MARQTGLLRRPLAFATGVVGFALVVVYVILIAREGDDSFMAVVPWAGLMTLPAAAAFAGLQVKDRRIAGNLMATAALLFVALGVLSILTIGLLFLFAAVLAIVSALQMKTTRRCPFCAEDVKMEAIVCRYCGRDLPEAS